MEDDDTQEGSRRPFPPEEQEALIMAYIFASRDPIKGKDQSKGELWKKIRAEYRKKWQGPNRTTKSLQNKLSSIKRECKRYTNCVRPLFRNPKSGFTITDSVSI